MHINKLLTVVLAITAVSCANDAPKPSTESHVDLIYRGSIAEYGSRGLKELSYERHGMVVDTTSNWKGGLSKGFGERPVDDQDKNGLADHAVSHSVSPPTPISTSSTSPAAATAAGKNAQQHSIYTTNASSFQPDRIDKGKCSYVVQKGDTLWSISGEKLGDNLQWHRIYRDNEIAIGTNPDLIFPDQQYWIDRCNGR